MRRLYNETGQTCNNVSSYWPKFPTALLSSICYRYFGRSLIHCFFILCISGYIIYKILILYINCSTSRVGKEQGRNAVHQVQAGSRQAEETARRNTSGAGEEAGRIQGCGRQTSVRHR